MKSSSSVGGGMPPNYSNFSSSTTSSATGVSDEDASSGELVDTGEPDQSKAGLFLQGLYQGQPQPDALAQEVFNFLLRIEAYEQFVPAFRKYQQSLTSQAEADGPAPKPTLILKLPRDWTPCAPAEMLDALRSVKVQRVVVLPPTTPGNVGEVNDPVSDDVCDMVATLLQSSTTELAVRARLSNPGVVAQAIAASDRLCSLELGNAMHDEMTTLATHSTAEKDSYVALTRGAMARPTLRRLGVHHLALLEPLTPVIQKMQAHGPALTSVFVQLDVNPEEELPAEHHLTAFMTVMRGYKQLEAVSAHGSCGSQKVVLKGMLAPLQHHESLTKVDIQCGPLNKYLDPTVFDAFPMAMDFSGTCPSLTHFSWNCEALQTTQIRQIMKEIFCIPSYFEKSEGVATTLKNPNSKLQHFSFNGIPVSQGAMRSCFSALAHNNVLQTLSLAHCVIDLLVTKLAFKSLLRNGTLRDLVFPIHPWEYCLVVNKKLLCSFLPRPGGLKIPIEQPLPSNNFGPSPIVDLDTKSSALLQSTFTPELKAYAEAISESPMEYLKGYRRQQPGWADVPLELQDAYRHMPASVLALLGAASTTRTTTSTSATTTTTGTTVRTTGSTDRRSRKKPDGSDA